MSETLITIAAACSGAIAGALGGWLFGRRWRGRPAFALMMMIGSVVAGCYLAWRIAAGGDPALSAVGIGLAFGAMTGIKYASGLVPGLEIGSGSANGAVQRLQPGANGEAVEESPPLPLATTERAGD